VKVPRQRQRLQDNFMPSTSLSHASSSRQAILVMCLGALCLVLNDASSKWLVDRYSPFQIMFMRSLLALPLVVVLVLWLDGKAALKTHSLGVHALRGVLRVASAYLFILSLGTLPLAKATSLLFAAPLIVTALAALILGDHVGWRRWLAVIAGFVGVLIIVRPGAATFQVASLLAAAAAVLYALILLSARWIDARDNVRTLMFYLTLFPLLLTSLVLFMDWPAMTSFDMLLFFGMGLFSTLGATLITQAFRMAPVAVVAPFDYTAILWSTGLGWMIWGNVPDIWVYAGAAVIVGSGIYVISRGSGRAS
jgi:drug/metabolite transporter (DMT)-like permease